MGPGPHVRDWVVVSCDGDEEARYRGRRFTFRPCAVVRFSRTSSALNPYDLWARSPVSKTGLLGLQVCAGRDFP
jgi:hypothetical protein